METTVLIIGAGPSGLSTAACLSRSSIPYKLLEREDCSASLWRKYAYDRLCLHLPKQSSDLAFMRLPSSFPKYVPKKLFLEYLDSYISHFCIDPLYRRNVEAAEFDRDLKKWKVRVKRSDDVGAGEEEEEEEYVRRFLVVATGETADPYTPAVEGLGRFGGGVIHSTSYKSGKGFEEKNVLVVGAGNSGMEIALDLANHAATTSILVRSPVLCSEISKVESNNNVIFKDGKVHPFDSIIFCTGFTSSAKLWLKDDDYLLNDEGLSKVSPPNHWKGNNGLYCVGLKKRGLYGSKFEAQEVAKDIEAQLQSV